MSMKQVNDTRVVPRSNKSTRSFSPNSRSPNSNRNRHGENAFARDGGRRGNEHAWDGGIAGDSFQSLSGDLREKERTMADRLGPRHLRAVDNTDYGDMTDLEPLIGTWQYKNGSSLVEMSCQWIAGKKFLERNFTMSENGKVTAQESRSLGKIPKPTNYFLAIRFNRSS